MLGNTSKSKYATVGTVFPRFEDPEVEQAYLQDIAHENQSRVRIGFWFCVGILICAFIASIFISPSSGNLIWVAIAFGFLLLLRETPVQYLEYSLITIETIILSLLLMTNDFRIQRILPGYEIPDTDFNRAWDTCDTDHSCARRLPDLLVVRSEIIPGSLHHPSEAVMDRVCLLLRLLRLFRGVPRAQTRRRRRQRLLAAAPRAGLRLLVILGPPPGAAPPGALGAAWPAGCRDRVAERARAPRLPYRGFHTGRSHHTGVRVPPPLRR